MAEINHIADLVVALLKGPPLNLAQAERLYLPVYQLEDMETLHVSVVPGSLDGRPWSRSHHLVDYLIFIGFQQRVTAPTPEILDPLMDLVQEAADAIRETPLEQYGKPLEVTNDPAYVPEHLEELHQFTSVLAVTYKGQRP